MFITFNTQEGLERSLNYLCENDFTGHKNKDREEYYKKNPHKMKFELFGESPVVTSAPEPSNIIWENLEIEGKTM